MVCLLIEVFYAVMDDNNNNESPIIALIFIDLHEVKCLLDNLNIHKPQHP